MTIRIIQGDTREELPKLAADFFDCIVTSPPYFGLRDYGCAGQIGLEPTLEAYLETIVAVCRELRRVLKPSGVFFLNIGDSYTQPASGRTGTDRPKNYELNNTTYIKRKIPNGLKPKDLCLVPERLGIMLQTDGWYVRSHIIWAKKNPMPESVTDRPTSAHETIWMLTKSARYYWDAEAVKESATPYRSTNREYIDENSSGGFRGKDGFKDWRPDNGRNMRNVWHVASQPFPGAHFATMPAEIAERCIKAGSSEKGCCTSCGVPWVRETIGETTEPSYRHGNKPIRKLASAEAGIGQTNLSSSNLGMVKSITTLGWKQSCKCTEFRCPTCANVLDIHDDKHDGMYGLQEAISTGQAGKEILQPDVPISGQAAIAEHQMQGVRGDVQAERVNNKVLQQTMFLQGYGEEQENNERLDNNQQRLSDDSSSKTPERDTLRVHDGTSFSYGESTRSLSNECGSGSPQKRRPARQQNRKLGVNGEEGPRRPQKTNLYGGMSPLQKGISSERPCPHCGSIMERATPAPVPSEILDCFAGAGTTGLVADRLGRNATLIDLNTKYMDMARDRIVDDAPLFVEIAAQ